MLETKLAEEWHSRWFRELLELREVAYDNDPAAYRSTCIPRLNDVPELWESYHIPLSELDDERAVKYLELASRALLTTEL